MLPYEPRYLRPITFFCLLMTGIILEVLVHLTFGLSIVYTHFFYLILVLAGLWFHQRAVYLAVVFALAHIGVQYVLSGAFTPDTTLRGIMFVIVSYVVGTVAKRLEDRNIELEETNLKLAASEQAFLIANRKLNLLSNITRHDILNQVTSLFGYLTLAMETEGGPGRCIYIQKAEECAVTIRQQIAFTREYQDVGIHAPRWQSLKKSIQGCLGSYEPGGVEIIKPDEDYEILADPLLPRIFYNLIDNSIRHGETVTRIHVFTHKNGERLVIRYEDNGAGVPIDEKKRIFEAGFGKNTRFGLFYPRRSSPSPGLQSVRPGSREKVRVFPSTSRMEPTGQSRMSAGPSRTAMALPERRRAVYNPGWDGVARGESGRERGLVSDKPVYPADHTHISQQKRRGCIHLVPFGRSSVRRDQSSPGYLFTIRQIAIPGGVKDLFNCPPAPAISHGEHSHPLLVSGSLLL